MTLDAQEKKFLKALVERELKHFERDAASIPVDLPVTFLKGEHDYGHFLERLLKNLE